jgi:GNAT superfamily N-acetyltransferase
MPLLYKSDIGKRIYNPLGVLSVNGGKMDIRIRPAVQADIPTLANIIRSLNYFAHITSEAPEKTEERMGRHLALCDADQSHLILVAQDSSTGPVVGYGAVHWNPYLLLAGPEGYVSELFVTQAYRGHGIGKKILNAIKAEAEKRGCARLMLLNLRRRESYQRRFYAKAGWEERPDVANFILPLDGSG